MKKLFSLCATLCMIMMLSGCGTILTRGPLARWNDKTSIYPATSWDANALYVVMSDPLDEQQWYLDLPARPVIGGFWVVDLMPSLLVDTVMLPIDVFQIQWTTKNKQ